MNRASQLLFAVLLLGGSLQAAPLPTGPDQITLGNEENALQVFTFKPEDYDGGPLLVVMHGVNRNAEDYRDWSIGLARKLKCLVIAPQFDKKRFPKAAYQNGGILDEKGVAQPESRWTYARLLEIIDQVRRDEGQPGLKYALIGHSAGGQFLTRFAAFAPHQASHIIAANPGSLLFPRRDWAFGYGFGELPTSLSDDAALQRYLAAPLTLYLGTADTSTTQSTLDVSAPALLQGPCRLDRSRNAYAFAQKLAEEKGWPFHWRKVETPGIAHDAKAMFSAPEVLEALAGFR